jgi:RsiW-degrading membrane proteinase PrsW (M82 family)
MFAHSKAARRQTAIWMVVVVAAAGLVVVVPRLVDVPSDGAVTLVAWIGAALHLVVLLLVGWLLLPKRRAAVTTVLMSAVIGATFCAGAGILLNGWAAAAQMEVLIAAPVSEEVAKLAAIVLVLMALGAGLRGPLDGLVVGYFVGVGFGVVENILYSYRAGSVGEAWQLVIARAVTGRGRTGCSRGSRERGWRI